MSNLLSTSQCAGRESGALSFSPRQVGGLLAALGCGASLAEEPPWTRWRVPRAPTGGPGALTRSAQWRRFLDEVMGMGLDILVTEFDVSDRALPSDPAVRDAGVAAIARDWLDVTLASPRLRRLLCWGLADRYSWLQVDQPRADGLPKRPLPYDDQLRPKPLRTAIADALRAMPAR